MSSLRIRSTLAAIRMGHPEKMFARVPTMMVTAIPDARQTITTPEGISAMSGGVQWISSTGATIRWPIAVLRPAGTPTRTELAIVTRPSMTGTVTMVAAAGCRALVGVTALAMLTQQSGGPPPMIAILTPIPACVDTQWLTIVCGTKDSKAGALVGGTPSLAIGSRSQKLCLCVDGRPIAARR